MRDVKLDDRYDLDRDEVILSGGQAIVRLTMMQQARDAAEGLSTAGYVTGYRGSPVGGLDQQFWRAKGPLAKAGIVFRPGLNEDLAATSVWGTQQAELRGEGRYDGVFGIWYGKGPGVDRTGDAFKHANLAGTSPHGGVLALMGDDHTCESSTTAHQSEFAFVDAMIPVLSPAGVQELLDFGILGIALSRYAGTWVAVKCVKDTIESTAVVDGAIDRVKVVVPNGFDLPADGVSIRRFDNPIAQEARLHDHKLPAVRAFVAANAIDRLVWSGGERPRIGIVSLGKSFLDVRQALDDLGIDEAAAERMGIRLLKIGCAWPLEPGIIERFAEGLDEIVVVEEKRALLETQIKEILYGRDIRPRVVGKRDDRGEVLFSSKYGLDSGDIAIGIGQRLEALLDAGALAGRLEGLKRAAAEFGTLPEIADRRAHFCAGCPHNTSTVVPEGSRAFAGIGCHYMAQWMERGIEGYTQMGAEGANWVGEAPFSKVGHVFQNLGDGTYNHSGYLAIRAAAAAGVNITYKILFNDAVAMTGGQPNDGGLTVPEIAAQVAAEGARRIAIVSDEPHKYPAGTAWPFGTTFHHRSELDAVQRELSGVEGLSILIYDQTCAAEKRRRRKRGTFPDPDVRVFVNDLVCEGCGDCGIQSNCVAIQPLETAFGRKRRVDQSSCNKDFSCLKGFCPAFVTVTGARLRHGEPVAESAAAPALPEPVLPDLQQPWTIVVTGIGGTGVVTIGQVLAMAAYVDGKGAALIDMAGLAQKGGAVTSHLRIAARPEDIAAIRVAPEGADVVIGCDLVVTGGKKTLGTIGNGRTVVLVNDHETPTADFTRNADVTLPSRRLKKALTERAGEANIRFFDSLELADGLLGDVLAANMIMLGAAWQLGRIPISEAAILKAIELNGAAIAMNKAAFHWGRRFIVDPAMVRDALPKSTVVRPAADLAGLVEERAKFLADYQNGAYGERYRARVAAIAAAENAAMPGSTALAEATARALFRMMAVKDEYEVGRLYSNGAFEKRLKGTFESWTRVDYHLSPPFIAAFDENAGRPKKYRFGPWVKSAFGLLAGLKFLRGTPFDVFGYNPERRMERRLLAAFEARLDRIAGGLTAGNLEAAVALVEAHRKVRGFGPVKDASVARFEAALPALEKAFADAAGTPAAAGAETGSGAAA
ncbi:MAG: indolepyruvate ferredoxin oxidoreductase family protein [Hyphomicrobiales bacterium]